MSSISKTRIESIDILRGLAMVIMALDHVRDYFHISANVDDPLNLATTTPALFFTRWITHFCAPVFVFLSGTSVFLQSKRKSVQELRAFLIKRGLWLVIAEVLIVSLGWSFNPQYNYVFLQVIWAIGISMILLGFIISLPYKLLLTLGLILVVGHNLLDIPESAPDFRAGFWWDLIHHGHFVTYSIAENHSAFIVYPFLPWLGLMILGFCAGKLYANDFPKNRRTALLNKTGVAAILFFIIIRFINIYGDPVPWSTQNNIVFSFLSFIDTEKYPPSLLYICMTIGPALLLLAYLEKVKNKLTDALMIFGRVAFFYYIAHIYLIHLITAAFYFYRGHTLAEAQINGNIFPFYFLVAGEGFHLPATYFIWIVVVLLLFPLSKWYDSYKTKNKDKWWLSYL
ncbi:MAG: DUF1624 domain-containing protein [Bacteroidetes bacterium]|nr:DUF1624 domain-containing protein [Bacteroidota bacterium]